MFYFYLKKKQKKANRTCFDKIGQLLKHAAYVEFHTLTSYHRFKINTGYTNTDVLWLCWVGYFRLTYSINTRVSRGRMFAKG